jgi:hypothetical protein
MDWDVIGSVGELLGSIGALATLIYIAVQVRDAKRVNLINTSAELTDNIAVRVIENPRLAEIIASIDSKTGHFNPPVKAAMEEWNLSAEDALIWSRYWGSVWRGFYWRFEAGSLDDRSLSLFLENPQSVLFLRNTKRTFSSAFIEKIDSVNPGVFQLNS